MRFQVATTLLAVSFSGAITMAAGGGAATGAAKSGGNWPQFRGPNASGIAEGSAPIHWDATTGDNIKWKTAIPGLGHSSPVIWGDRLFVTTAVSGVKNAELKVGLYGSVESVIDDSQHTWRVYCLDKNSGKILWDRVANKGVPRVKRHTKASHANSTPATDGKHVVAFFGSEGLHCYDMDGKLLWKKDFGTLDAGWYVDPGAQWGFGSSPIIHDGKVIIQCDVQKNSFLAALTIENGEELWRIPRNDVPTWSTPTILVGPKRTQVIVNGHKHIGGYNVETGRGVWMLKGGGDIPVPTPIVHKNVIFITSAHGRSAPIFAIRATAEGDITLPTGEKSGRHILWSYTRRGNYMQTPLAYGKYLFTCHDNGIMMCYEIRTGELQYQKRLPGGRSGLTASPVAADGKIYLAGEDGDVYVVEAAPEFKLLATNKMGEVCMATPAISDGHLFIRTQHHVFSIGK